MTVIVLLFFVPVLVGILLALNALFAPHRPDAEKTTAYESGFMAITGQTRAPFSIAYYLIAILFLVFDLEILLIYPFAVTIYTVGLYGFWIVTIFFLVLTFGFVIEIAKGVLNFTDQRSPQRDSSKIGIAPPCRGGQWRFEPALSRVSQG